MLSNDDTMNLLIDLGLTCSQAKAYSALTILKKAEAKKIAKASNIARQDIYRIMPELEQVGLVEKIVASPILYKAVPLREGCKKLLERKTNQCLTLQEKLKLIENQPTSEVETEEGEAANQFILTSERNLFQRKMDEKIASAKVSIKAVLGSEGVKIILFNHFSTFKGALERGVKITIITEKNDIKLSRNEQTLCKNPLFEIRYVEELVPYVFTIFDDKAVNIRVTDATIPSLWTNNQTVVKLAETAFETFWNKAAH
jgi:sugar-specific transcriptional regulator TrmB